MKRTTGKAANTAIGYVRVSTIGQVEDGISLEAQEAQIRAYATLRGFVLVDVIVDAGVSAGEPLEAREGGCKLLSIVAKKQASVVIASKLDRLFRDAANCLTVTGAWDKAGVALHLIDLGGQSIDTASAMGRMFLTMAAGFAEMERNLIKERTKAALQHKKAKGERVGNIAYGFQLATDGVTLEPSQAEQEIIAAVFELKAAGLSQRKIADELNKRGLVNRAGGVFMQKQIVNILAGAA